MNLLDEAADASLMTEHVGETNRCFSRDLYDPPHHMFYRYIIDFLHVMFFLSTQTVGEAPEMLSGNFVVVFFARQVPYGQLPQPAAQVFFKKCLSVLPRRPLNCWQDRASLSLCLSGCLRYKKRPGTRKDPCLVKGHLQGTQRIWTHRITGTWPVSYLSHFLARKIGHAVPSLPVREAFQAGRWVSSWDSQKAASSRGSASPLPSLLHAASCFLRPSSEVTPKRFKPVTPKTHESKGVHLFIQKKRFFFGGAKRIFFSWFLCTWAYTLPKHPCWMLLCSLQRSGC